MINTIASIAYLYYKIIKSQKLKFFVQLRSIDIHLHKNTFEFTERQLQVLKHEIWPCCSFQQYLKKIIVLLF